MAHHLAIASSSSRRLLDRTVTREASSVVRPRELRVTMSSPLRNAGWALSTLTWSIRRARLNATLRWGAHANEYLEPMIAWVFFLTFSGTGFRALIGWVGYGIIVVLSAAVFIAMFVIAGRRVTIRRVPWTIAAFLLVCWMSALWAEYPGISALASLGSTLSALIGIMIAIAVPLERLIDAFAAAMRWSVGISLVMELWCAIFVGHPIVPVWLRGQSNVGATQLWTESALFRGGPIQGFVGNRNPLAAIALFGIICTVIQLRARRMSSRRALTWFALYAATLALTRSATVFVALLACAGVFLVGTVLRRVRAHRRQRVLRISAMALLIVSVVGALLYAPIAEFIGRDADLTGRSDIWRAVFELWKQRPIGGWGWVMLWPPWIPMYRDLVIRQDGAPTPHAHNAFVDVSFQTGLIGLAVFVIAICVIGIRVLRVAIRRIDGDVYSLAPALMMTAILVQSLTESRLLFEGTWILFVALATWLVVRVEQEDSEVGVGVLSLPVPPSPGQRGRAPQDTTYSADRRGRVPAQPPESR